MFDFESLGTVFGIDDFDELEAEPLPALAPRWRAHRWWQDAPHDHPGFDDLEAHACYTIERYARPTLDSLNASDDDPVLEHKGKMVSLNELLAPYRII
ncbi:hypothetical protein [Sphingomonas sp. Leaf242]|uniref:hypothetical protein n=1 Tax=Sphingomonas sp. Leaf242 TaxID=1736304 RepID=UPI000A95F72F|nr:hypothetical protein [Sphingomonas sp. Leaf242]